MVFGKKPLQLNNDLKRVWDNHVCPKLFCVKCKKEDIF